METANTYFLKISLDKVACVDGIAFCYATRKEAQIYASFIKARTDRKLSVVKIDSPSFSFRIVKLSAKMVEWDEARKAKRAAKKAAKQPRETWTEADYDKMRDKYDRQFKS